jgi:hypothetical protein
VQGAADWLEPVEDSVAGISVDKITKQRSDSTTGSARSTGTARATRTALTDAGLSGARELAESARPGNNKRRHEKRRRHTRKEHWKWCSMGGSGQLVASRAGDGTIATSSARDTRAVSRGSHRAAVLCRNQGKCRHNLHRR